MSQRGGVAAFVFSFPMFFTRGFRTIKNVIVCIVASALHRLHIDRAYQFALTAIDTGEAFPQEADTGPGVIVKAFESNQCDSSTEEEQNFDGFAESEAQKQFGSKRLSKERSKSTDNQADGAEGQVELQRETHQAPGEDPSGPLRPRGKLETLALPTVSKAIAMLECKKLSSKSRGCDVKPESPVKEILNSKHAVKVKIYAIEAKMRDQRTFPPPPLQAEQIREAYATERVATPKHLLPKSFEYVCQKRG
uniref:AlNc14C1G54 protein n=1 Tax=Albugo laibachii Nc14 TaxID=890382 RepID=F0VYQ2_9STRA|nr:AlNc14C1G54 [Albugo laibachii Nc14]|eukprot:CCA13916.1 AlNc14C1G54 [Albugo laibachii Nc14]